MNNITRFLSLVAWKIVILSGWDSVFAALNDRQIITLAALSSPAMSSRNHRSKMTIWKISKL